VGALTGQLLGLIHGHEIIPPRWLEQLELREVITRMAEDVAIEHQDGTEWKALHPPV
jgi:ADP-ribosylglycohydrolase